MMTAGTNLDSSKESSDYQVALQTSMLKMQMNLEDVFAELAENESYFKQKPAVVLIDRGLFDGSAYIPEEVWQEIIDEQGWSGINFIEKRYDAIMHMVTAADGAEEFYNFDNEARFETVEQAVERDKKLRQAYLGHNRHMVVNNQAGSFEKKVSSAINQIAHAIGLPTDV